MNNIKKDRVEDVQWSPSANVNLFLLVFFVNLRCLKMLAYTVPELEARPSVDGQPAVEAKQCALGTPKSKAYCS